MPTVVDRPWHLLPVAMIALLWHAAGALDYLLTQIDYAPYTSQVPAEWLEYFLGQPIWVTAAWAVGVWGGLLGAILLLAREHWAPLALAASFFGTLAATVWLTLLAQPPMQAAIGQGFTAVMVGACIAGFLLWIYARWMRRAGVIT